MCIIVSKPKGVAFPSKSTLKTCFENNPDGAGFMFAHNGGVFITKGLMTFNAFYKALKNARIKYGDDIPYVMHFRITTQAGVRPDCTHPYPLSSDMNELRRLHFKTNIGVAHNGVISLTSNGFNKSITYNDTMEFITDYLSLIIDSPKYYEDDKKLLLIERLCDSKLAILNGDGHIQYVGVGWLCENGVFYSNKSYDNFSYINYNKYYDYRNYDEYEAYYNYQTYEYEFDDEFCPVVLDNDYSYCDMCCCCKQCKRYANKIKDYELLLVDDEMECDS